MHTCRWRRWHVVGDAMIGVKTVVGGVPLEKREAVGPRKISRAWQLTVNMKWKSKPGKLC